MNTSSSSSLFSIRLYPRSALSFLSLTPHACLNFPAVFTTSQSMILQVWPLRGTHADKIKVPIFSTGTIHSSPTDRATTLDSHLEILTHFASCNTAAGAARDKGSSRHVSRRDCPRIRRDLIVASQNMLLSTTVGINIALIVPRPPEIEQRHPTATLLI